MINRIVESAGRGNLASNEMVHLEAGERFMKLAMRAQNQCRATLETLADIKNPSHVAFVKQANISAGHQQVNNGVAAPMGASRADENEIPQNKVLELKHVERVDTRAPSAPSRTNQELEAVDAVYWPSDTSGRARVSRNAYKGGERPALRKLARVLRQLIKRA